MKSHCAFALRLPVHTVPADRYVTMHNKSFASDLMRVPRRKDEGSRRAVNLLADLSHLFPTVPDVLEGNGEIAIDNALRRFFCERFPRDFTWVMVPRAVDKVFAILGQQHAGDRRRVVAGHVQVFVKGSQHL